MIRRAVWQATVIAESDDMKVVDGYACFPVEAVNHRYLHPSTLRRRLAWSHPQNRERWAGRVRRRRGVSHLKPDNVSAIPPAPHPVLPRREDGPEVVHEPRERGGGAGQGHGRRRHRHRRLVGLVGLRDEVAAGWDEDPEGGASSDERDGTGLHQPGLLDLRDLVGSDPRPVWRTRTGATGGEGSHFASVWGAELVVLPPLSLGPPVRKWGATELAFDGLHHLVYALTTDLAYARLRR